MRRLSACTSGSPAARTAHTQALPAPVEQGLHHLPHLATTSIRLVAGCACQAPLLQAGGAEEVLHQPLEPQRPPVDPGHHLPHLGRGEAVEVLHQQLGRGGQGHQGPPQLVGHHGEDGQPGRPARAARPVRGASSPGAGADADADAGAASARPAPRLGPGGGRARAGRGRLRGRPQARGGDDGGSSTERSAEGSSPASAGCGVITFASTRDGVPSPLPAESYGRMPVTGERCYLPDSLATANRQEKVAV